MHCSSAPFSEFKTIFFFTTYTHLYLTQWEDFQSYQQAIGWQADKVCMKGTIGFNWMQEWVLSHTKWEMFVQSEKTLFG